MRVADLAKELGKNPAEIAISIIAEIINEDPYGEGWIIKVELDDPSELDDLLSAEDYENLISD